MRWLLPDYDVQITLINLSAVRSEPWEQLARLRRNKQGKFAEQFI